MDILIPLESSLPPLGLQAKELMGLTVNAINELSDSDVTSFKKYYEELYARAFRALEVDCQRILSGYYRFEDGEMLTGRFNFNFKFSALESSEYISSIITPSVISEQIYYTSSMYSAINLNWVEFFSVADVIPLVAINISITTPTGIQVQFPIQMQVKAGKNRIPIHSLLPFDDTTGYVTIALNFPIPIALYATQQRYFTNGFWTNKGCGCRCPYAGGEINTITLEPGLNIQVSGNCSMQRFIESNIPIFKYSLYYSIGREFIKDRVTSDRINQYTVLTIERAEELRLAYERDYTNSLLALRDIQSVEEDGFCFSCKKILSSSNLLP